MGEVLLANSGLLEIIFVITSRCDYPQFCYVRIFWKAMVGESTRTWTTSACSTGCLCLGPIIDLGLKHMGPKTVFSKWMQVAQIFCYYYWMFAFVKIKQKIQCFNNIWNSSCQIVGTSRRPIGFTHFLHVVSLHHNTSLALFCCLVLYPLWRHVVREEIWTKTRPTWEL